MKTKDEQLYI